MPSPLAGIGVLELGAGSAIAYAGKLFADLGADVTRLGITRGESANYTTREDGATTGLALYLNARKKSAVIDFTDDGGRGEMSELFSRNRVLLHAPIDHAQASALRPEAIAAEFPYLIVVSVT